MTHRAPLEEFDPAKLQDGLLMAVENVHEKLRDAREKHRVMVGNPIIETPAQNLDMAGVTVLGYDECQTVLTRSRELLIVDLREHHGPGHGAHAARNRRETSTMRAGRWCRRCSGRSCWSGGALSWSRWWCMS